MIWRWKVEDPLLPTPTRRDYPPVPLHVYTCPAAHYALWLVHMRLTDAHELLELARAQVDSRSSYQ